MLSRPAVSSGFESHAVRVATDFDSLLSIRNSSAGDPTCLERTIHVNEAHVEPSVTDSPLTGRLAQTCPLAVGAGLAVLTIVVAELLPPARLPTYTR
jgi:hypothetical protein